MQTRIYRQKNVLFALTFEGTYIKSIFLKTGATLILARDLDPLVIGMDPRIRIRIHTNMCHGSVTLLLLLYFLSEQNNVNVPLKST